MSTENVSVSADEHTNDAVADELLAVRCQLGEASAFDELVGRWHLPLWRYLRRLIGDEHAAAETLQDVWLAVLRAMPGLREPARLRAWLFGIARRVVMNHLRQSYAEPDAVPVDPDDLAAPDENDDLTEDIVRLHDALAGMPVIEREVLVLFYLRELSLAQLADVLAVPLGTIKSRLFRARRMLRQQLTQRENAND
ncbi:MAG: sigma-70 family RNA polymerase sigma factor [Gemmatimonas sp.]